MSPACVCACACVHASVAKDKSLSGMLVAYEHHGQSPLLKEGKFLLVPPPCPTLLPALGWGLGSQRKSESSQGRSRGGWPFRNASHRGKKNQQGREALEGVSWGCCDKLGSSEDYRPPLPSSGGWSCAP